MSKRNLGEKIKLQSYNDMFGEDENAEVIVQEQIKDVALSELHTFKNHPFRVSDDTKMEEMIESVKQYGILVPAIARSRTEGGYELISGHRRHYAATIAGLETMPVMIKDCSDDEATVIMVDANIQREDISISEKAKAYRMKYDAMKHQGMAGGITLEEMSDSAGESRKTIQRLICLSNLSDEYLELIDSKKLGICDWKKMQEISKGVPPILEFPKEMFEEKVIRIESDGTKIMKSDFELYCEKYNLRYCIMPDLNPNDDYIPVAVPELRTLEFIRNRLKRLWSEESVVKKIRTRFSMQRQLKKQLQKQDAR